MSREKPAEPSTRCKRSKPLGANQKSLFNDQSPFHKTRGIVVSFIWGHGTSRKSKTLVGGMAIDRETVPIEGYAREACISRSKPRNLSDAGTWLSNPQRHPRADRPNCALRIEVFPHTFINHATRMIYLFVLKTKMATEVRKCFLKFTNIIEQDGCCIKLI